MLHSTPHQQGLADEGDDVTGESASDTEESWQSPQSVRGHILMFEQLSAVKQGRPEAQSDRVRRQLGLAEEQLPQAEGQLGLAEELLPQAGGQSHQAEGSASISDSIPTDVDAESVLESIEVGSSAVHMHACRLDVKQVVGYLHR